MDEDYTIYQYADPQSQEIMYIGVTNNPVRRFKQHKKNSKGACYQWLQELEEQGLEPLITIIDKEINLNIARALEKKHIKDKKPQLNISANGQAIREREELNNKNREIALLAKQYNISTSEAAFYHNIQQELYEYGGGMAYAWGEINSTSWAIVAATVRSMEEIFKIDKPLTDLEIMRLAHHVIGRNDDMGVER